MTAELATACVVMGVIVAGLMAGAGSGRSGAKRAANEIVALLAKGHPELRPVVALDGACRASIELMGCWVVTLTSESKGVHAQVLRPGLPGEDEPAFQIRIYDYVSLVDRLARYALGVLTIYDLRVGAVYEVIRDFDDHYGTHFSSGTALTFVSRNFLPYEGGHTVTFRECTVYIQDESEVYARFAEHFAYAARQQTSPQGMGRRAGTEEAS